jgi:hypothetical protein
MKASEVGEGAVWCLMYSIGDGTFKIQLREVCIRTDQIIQFVWRRYMTQPVGGWNERSARVGKSRAVSERVELTHSPAQTTTAFSSVPVSKSSSSMAAFSKKEEEGLSSYYNNKTTVIQEARVFNESPISPRKCRALLTRIVFLLYIGENFGSQEATTLFFGTTKLFQHKDVRS